MHPTTHEHKSLQEEILDIVNDRRDPNFLTYTPLKRFAITTVDILEAAGELAYTVKDENNLTAAALSVYDELCKQFDFPWLNDATELMAEAMGRQFIAPVLHLIYPKIMSQPGNDQQA